jgi:hypothetical protein
MPPSLKYQCRTSRESFSMAAGVTEVSGPVRPYFASGSERAQSRWKASSR